MRCEILLETDTHGHCKVEVKISVELLLIPELAGALKLMRDSE